MINRLLLFFCLQLFAVNLRADAFPGSCSDCCSGCLPRIDARPAYFYVTGTTLFPEYNFYYGFGAGKTILLDSLLLRAAGGRDLQIWAEHKTSKLVTPKIILDKYSSNYHITITDVVVSPNGNSAYLKVSKEHFDLKNYRAAGRKKAGIFTLSFTSLISFLIFLWLWKRRKQTAA